MPIEEPKRLSSKPDAKKMAKIKRLRKIRRRRRLYRAAFTLVVLLTLAGAAFFYIRAEKDRRQVEEQLADTMRQLQDAQNSQATETTEEPGVDRSEKILARVRSHIELPESPKPEVLTIDDAENLRTQADFYANAQNGDYLVVTDKWAILYSPDRDKIYNFANLSAAPAAPEQPGDDEPAASPEVSPAPSPPANPTL